MKTAKTAAPAVWQPTAYLRWVAHQDAGGFEGEARLQQQWNLVQGGAVKQTEWRDVGTVAAA